MSDTHKQVRDMIKSFYPFAKKRYGFDRAAKIVLNRDAENSSKPLGKTAYYDPQNSSVTVFTHNRHPKDIMRSISHELVHHTQNCRGDLSNVAGEQGQGYAQENDHLREMEREAYEQGNLCFRDWEDGIKSNLEPGTIYEKRNTKMGTVKDHFKRRDANLFERTMKKFGYAVNESTWISEDLPEWMYSYIEHEAENAGASTHDMDYGEVKAAWVKFTQAAVASLEEMMGEIGAEDYLDIDGDLYLLFQTISESGRSMEDGDFSHVDLPIEIEALAKGMQQRLARYVDYTGGGSLNDAIQNTIAGAEGYDRHSDAEANPHDGGMYGEPEGGYDAPVDEGFTYMGRDKDGNTVKRDTADPKKKKNKDDWYDELNSWTKKKKKKTDEANEGGEGVHDIFNMPEPEAVEPTGNPKEDALRQIVAQSQAAKIDGVLVDVYTASAIVQILDRIVTGPAADQPDMREKYLAAPIHIMAKIALGQIKERKIKEALKRAFKKNPALIEVAKKVDMKKLVERFRGSPEEKEMTSKMSNKEFSDYHTRDKHIMPDLKGDMGPIPGMEGPFQYASGAVLYYDNKAGKYYDRGRDMHIDDEEASRLTMNEGEGDQFQKGDHVQDDRTNKAYVVVEPMAGGAVVENEEGKIEKIRSQFLSKVEGAPQIMKEGDFIGHHAMIDGEYFVDSNFLNKLNKIPEMGSLDHMGFGDFSFNSQDGKEMRFSRGGQDIPGQVGRSHKVYAHPPEFIEEVVAALEAGGHTTSETEALPQGEPTMQNEEIARKLKSLLEGKKIKKSQVDKLAKMVAAKLLEGKYKRDDEEKDEEEIEEGFLGFGGPSKDGIEWLQNQVSKFGQWRMEILDGLDGRTHNDLQGLADELYQRYQRATADAPRGATQGKKNKGIAQVWDLLGKWVQGFRELGEMERAGKDQRKHILPAFEDLPGSELWHGRSAKPADIATMVKGAVQESGSACGGAPEAIKLKVDRDGDEPGDLPGDGLEPVAESDYALSAEDEAWGDSPEHPMSIEEFAEKHGLQVDRDQDGQKIIYVDQEQAAHLRTSGGDRVVADEGWSVEPDQSGGFIIYTGESGEDSALPPMQEKTKKDLADRRPTDTPADRLKAQEGKLPDALQAAIDKKKGDDDSDDKSSDESDDEKEDLDEKTKKDVADRKPSDTPQDRLKPLEERGYGRGNEEPGSMFDPYENEEDEYGGGYGGEEDELAQYKDLLAALDSGGPVDGGEIPADVQAQMDAEFGSEEDEEDPFGDPLKEWWDIRNARRTEKFMSWAIPKKK